MLAEPLGYCVRRLAFSSHLRRVRRLVGGRRLPVPHIPTRDQQNLWPRCDRGADAFRQPLRHLDDCFAGAHADDRAEGTPRIDMSDPCHQRGLALEREDASGDRNLRLVAVVVTSDDNVDVELIREALGDRSGDFGTEILVRDSLARERHNDDRRPRLRLGRQGKQNGERDDENEICPNSTKRRCVGNCHLGCLPQKSM